MQPVYLSDINTLSQSPFLCGTEPTDDRHQQNRLTDVWQLHWRRQQDKTEFGFINVINMFLHSHKVKRSTGETINNLKVIDQELRESQDQYEAINWDLFNFSSGHVFVHQGFFVCLLTHHCTLTFDPADIRMVTPQFPAAGKEK